jgi:hypothetical protein
MKNPKKALSFKKGIKKNNGRSVKTQKGILEYMHSLQGVILKKYSAI